MRTTEQTTDNTAARELALYAINDSGIYFGYTLPALKNLAKHKAKGPLDRDRALRSLFRVATEAAEHYRREHCSIFDKLSDLFPVTARHAAAAEMLDHYASHIDELASGNA